jgi:hypothetical protein
VLPVPSTAGNPKNFRSYLLGENQTPQPSKAYFLYNQPINFRTIPLVLMYPVFGTFCDEILTMPPSVEDSDLTQSLAQDMSRIYDDESHWRGLFRAWFTQTYKYDMETKVGPATSDAAPPSKLPKSDGHVLVRNFIILISKCKHEATSTSHDTQYQAMMYFAKLFTASEALQDHLGHSYLPVILIVYEGENSKTLNHIA